MNKSFIHKNIAIFLAFVLLAYNIKTILVITDFAIHQEEIAETLCVEKDDQQGCNGKCQLVIALKSDLPQNQDIPLKSIEKISFSINYLQPENNFEVSFIDISLITKSNFNITKQNIIKMDSEIIIPPPEFV